MKTVEHKYDSPRNVLLYSLCLMGHRLSAFQY